MSVEFIINFNFQCHSFIKISEQEQVDFARWVCKVMQLDPSTPTKTSTPSNAV